MALEELQDSRRVARGWEAISRFVCFLYSFKAAVKIVSKLVEEEELEGTWDMLVEGAFLEVQRIESSKGTDSRWRMMKALCTGK